MHGTEDDVPADPALAETREPGGTDEDTPGDASGDSTSTTGTDRIAEFVGRVAGDDVGYAGETGAERRAR